MAVPSQQIGWSQESKLLWYILKQLNQLAGAIFNLKTQATPKYKVYTALLTQSGGSAELKISSGPLTQGVTYYFGFLAAGPSWDFSNVGGPVFPDTTSFVATSSNVPNSYGGQTIYYNTGAPTVTILENTIGNIWFTYQSAGTYKANFSTEQNTNKLYVSALASYNNYYNFIGTYFSTTGVYFSTLNTSFVESDGWLSQTPIEIRVYN
jgi:hypothetical protein